MTTLHAASATTIRTIDTRTVRGGCGQRIEEIRDTSGGQAPTASPHISPHRDGYRYWLPEWEISSRPRVTCVREIDPDERNRGAVANRKGQRRGSRDPSSRPLPLLLPRIRTPSDIAGGRCRGDDGGWRRNSPGGG